MRRVLSSRTNAQKVFNSYRQKIDRSALVSVDQSHAKTLVRKDDYMKRNAIRLAASLLSVMVISVLFLPTRSQGTALPPADAAATYKAKCSSCHGADGSGSTATGKRLKLRDLRSAEVQNQTDDQLYAIIAKGKGKMPGYGKSLHEAGCKAQVAFIRTLRK